eukprot:gnl/TRDRNA2_/TRDRNA2_65108_c0_seq1.p1 gnl/TRDRNA2_/TRDRNA2_65108_c0~~gnl/TRDRNA2_/TRDRNA2_65108_c0_seq1.p1  ORF type:complete len:281 (-),score=80.37 gnl/TRDRNA2_/TRDRNA2_65108_c0_seq1:153-995(-)
MALRVLESLFILVVLVVLLDVTDGKKRKKKRKPKKMWEVDPDYKEKKGAIELTPGNWDDIVYNSPQVKENATLTFVKFYTPSCPHSRAIADEYAQLAEHFNTPLHKPGAYLAQIAQFDCSGEEHLHFCLDNDVDTLPTVKWYHPTDTPKMGYTFQRTAGKDTKNTIATWKPFIEEHAKATCNVESFAFCKPEEKAFLVQARQWSPEKLQDEFDKINNVTKKKTQKLRDIEEGYKEVNSDEGQSAMSRTANSLRQIEKAWAKGYWKISLLEQEGAPKTPIV